MRGELRKLKLSATPGEPTRCALRVVAGDEERLLGLNEYLGAGLTLTFSGRIRCLYCGTATRKSYGGGHCYPCFKALARCDLCVVSPDRCHYHLGTCREPAWGEAFCMAPHLVYLANTSGLKVGITRQGNERERWLDQGAVQAMPVLTAQSRRDAGLAETAIAGRLADKTDWKALVSGDAVPLDLAAEQSRLRDDSLTLPDGVSWLAGLAPLSFAYPLVAYPPVRAQLRPDPAAPIAGNLLGIKGQYLLLSCGVLNVRRYAGYEVEVEIGDAFAEPRADSQLELF